MIGQWKSGGDGANTTKALVADKSTFAVVIYRRIVHFLTSLNAGGNICSVRVYFLTSLNLAVNTARLIHSYDKNVSYKIGNF